MLKLHYFVFSSNSLFAIPANQEFVYVHTASTESSDMLGYMASKLIQACKIGSSGSTSRSLASLDSYVTADDTEEGKVKTNEQIRVNIIFMHLQSLIRSGYFCNNTSI